VVGQDRIRDRIRKLSRRSGRTAAEQQVTKHVALHLASAIANIAAVYDPDAVILLGEIFPRMLDEIRRRIRRIVPWQVDVRLSQLGEDAALQGALAAGLSRAYAMIARSLQKDAAGQAAVAGGK
jgi:predicted NBD/HSP70 family sugar kinase